MTDSSSFVGGHRWATVTPDDRSGILYVVAFLNFTYSSITFTTRYSIKWHVLGPDDAATFAAQIASIIQFALLLASLSAGLAKNFDLLSEDEYARMATSQFAYQIVLYISLGLSKMSTILLMQRLFTLDMKKAWVTCKLVTATVVIWTMAAAFMVSVGCSPKSLAPETPSETCPTIVARVKFVVITDAITDVILVILPGFLCWHLQMSAVLKLQVLAVFAFRLPLVALSGLFLKTWIRSLSMANPGIRRTTPIVFQQAELCLSLIAATIPCLRSFIRSFDTGSGVKANIGSSNEYGSAGRNGGSSEMPDGGYGLSSMSKSDTETWRERIRPRFYDDDGTMRVNLGPFASGRSNTKLRRNQSLSGVLEPRDPDEADRQRHGSNKELFIRREMHWEVTSEEARRGSDLERPGMLRLPQ